MVFALAVPAYINQTISGSRGTWPIAQCRVELGGGPGRRVLIRCSLSMPGRSTIPGSSSSPRSMWFSSSLVSKDFFRSAWSTMLQNHRVWSEKSLQTLQRVGTMIRSTSKDCIAALATKTGTAKQPMPDPDQGPEMDAAAAGQLKASIGRFLTTAGAAEVQQAAMLSDLSNLAYDVSAIDHQQLQDRCNVVMVANSRTTAVAQEAEATPLHPTDTDNSRQQLPAAISTSVTSAEQLPLPATSGPAAAPSSPAVAGAPPTWDSALQYHHVPHSPRNNSAGTGSAPTSPRTPFVMCSMAEGEDVATAGFEMQPATASAELFSPGSPRRRSVTASATAAPAPTVTSMLAGAPAALTNVDTMPGSSFDSSVGLSRSSSAEAVLAAQFAQFQHHQDFIEELQPQQPTLEQQEQQALLELQQQEQAVLYEMQQQQQLQMLFQQEQAMLQMLQEQSSTVSPEAAAASTAWWWWWQQQQQQQAAASTSGNGSTAVGAEEQHPTDWFVCDEAAPNEPDSPVRYFVLQGSITLDHWRINLTIDPSEFEAGAFGPVKVHRGVYETALQMLDTFVPFVKDHLSQHPNGRFAFTGHSLGGSIATLLMLLMVHRGILPASSVATVRTFGAPAIFCEGATGSAPAAGTCQSCSLPCQHRAEQSAASTAAAGGAVGAEAAASGSLLGKLGLSEETVVNVVMTRDIVPRAFVCDYTLVADFMKSWMPGFKEHVGLAACKQHKALYNFIGTVEVLQPSTDCPFVLSDEAHAMLPDLPALYKLTEPSCDLPETQAGDSTFMLGNVGAEAQQHELLFPAAAATSAAAAAASDRQQVDAGMDHGMQELDAGLVAAIAVVCSACNSSSCSGCSRVAEQTGPAAHTAGATDADDEAQQQVAGELHDTASSATTTSSSDSPRRSKLGSLGSWGSLVSLGHLSLTTVIADLTSTFTLVTSNSGLVTVPADSGPEAASDDNGSNGCSGESVDSAAAASVYDRLQQETAAPAVLTPSAAERQPAAMTGPSAAATAVGEKTANPVDFTLGDAILTFMNSPHPLETLGEMRAYGPSGSISRFHNPNNYTVALQQLCMASGRRPTP